MRLHQNRFKSLVAAAGLSALAVAVPVFAQDGATESNAATTDAEDETPLSQFVDEATNKINEMQTIRQAALRKLDEARKSKDALALQCVNENVATIKAMVKLGQKAKSGVERAVAAGKKDKARREMSKLNAASSKTSEAGAAARNCAGGDAVDTSTDVELEVDESIGASDPYYGNNGQFSNPANAVVDSTGGATSTGTDSGTVAPPPPPTTGFQ